MSSLWGTTSERYTNGGDIACRLPGGVDSDSSFWQMLVEKRSGQTPKVPGSRFNIDAHYHENLGRWLV